MFCVLILCLYACAVLGVLSSINSITKATAIDLSTSKQSSYSVAHSLKLL
jgi:hypothetical protein